MTGKTLGRYKITGILGKGAMGVVYKGHDPKIDRQVALKTIRSEIFADESNREELLRRFQQEAQIAGRLSHNHIVGIYDVGEDDGITYIAMEYIDGKSLDKIIKDGIRLSIDQIVFTAIQVCDALDYAHRHGIIHRDIKPANIIIIGDANKVKVADFGIAKLVDADMTIGKRLMGTPYYMSPEQIKGGKYDGRSDLFSLGIVLYELLTGKKPFSGEDISTIIHNIINQTPLPPGKVNSNVPHLFNKVVLKALAKDPGDRYQTGHEFINTLRSTFKDDAGATIPDGYFKTIQKAGDRPELLEKIGLRGKFRRLLVAAVGVLLVIMSYSLWLKKREKQITPPPPTISEGYKDKSIIKMGYINVKSDPPNANIFIDGKNRGITPYLLEVSSGRHEVKLIKEGYLSWEATLEVQENETLNLFQTLKSR